MFATGTPPHATARAGEPFTSAGQRLASKNGLLGKELGGGSPLGLLTIAIEN